MRRESFMRGVVVAFIIAVFSATAFMMLKPVFGTTLVVRCLIAAGAGLYIVYLMSRSAEKSGRLAVPALWMLGTITAWYSAPTLILFLLAQTGMVWLVRSLYFHSGIVAALLDLGVCGAGVLAAVAAARSSSSVFLSAWSFFLVQALFTTIPSILRADSADPTNSAEERFQRALATAQAAVRRAHSD